MYNFRDIEAIKVIFFWKCEKLYIDLENEIKLEKILTVLKIIAIELVAGISVIYDKNTCDGPSSC